MTLQLNKNYLITTHEWFYAPDGEHYKAVFGKVTAVNSDKDTLGLETNKDSTNWYVIIGNMIIAGCQIHYAIQTNKVNFNPPVREIENSGELLFCKESRTRIYNANS